MPFPTMALEYVRVVVHIGKVGRDKCCDEHTYSMLPSGTIGCTFFPKPTHDDAGIEELTIRCCSIPAARGAKDGCCEEVQGMAVLRRC